MLKEFIETLNKNLNSTGIKVRESDLDVPLIVSNYQQYLDFVSEFEDKTIGNFIDRSYDLGIEYITNKDILNRLKFLDDNENCRNE